MMRKGIESIISVIVLVFITIAFLGIAYTLLSGQFSTYTTEKFNVPETLAECKLGKIKVYATTTDEVLNIDRFITKDIIYPGGSQVVSVNLTAANFPLKRGQQAKSIIDYDCGNPTSGCGNGAYTVVLATSTLKLERPVIC
ncbi:MAG: hypothetical protein HYX24_04970 [Candidatus Aenigmarchaeota archaeon]|nr:hypothetical protein [Candidatus Aenigmarchaeota archaeon]